MELQETYEVTGPQIDGLGAFEGKMPAPLKKPVTAWLITAVMVLVALFGMGGFKMGGARAEIAARYNGPSVNDMGKSTEGIAVNLGRRMDAAANIIRIGQRTLGEADPLVTAAQTALDALEIANGPRAQYAADTALSAAITALYNGCAGQAAGEQNGLEGQWAEFQSQRSIIEHDTYNAEAVRFNESIGGFPAGLIAAVSGGKVELFA